MGTTLQSLFNDLAAAVGNASNETLAWMVFAVVLLALLLPVYLRMKALASRGLIGDRPTMAGQDLVESLIKDAQLSPTRDSSDASHGEFGVLERSQTELASRLFGFLPSGVKISETVTVTEPTVVKMGNDEIKRAADLLRAGSDMDTVCRQVNPDYAQWPALQQRLFRMTMEKVLKSYADSSR